MTGHNTSTLYSYSYTRDLRSNQFYADQGKLLQTKSLGGAGAPGGSELSAWYEQAYAYYNSVMTGNEAQPDAATWNEFLSQMNWAYGQINGSGASGWGEGLSGPGMGQGQPGLGPDQFGGMPGTLNNYVHTEEEARVGYTGNVTRDFWSNEIDLDIAPLSAKVTAERTTDTRTQPPEDVIKVTVTDSATGTEAVYFIHDYADANIKINVPSATQVTDNTGGLVTVGKFQGNGGSASNESSAPYEVQENGDYLVEVPYGETISFQPVGDGDAQTWDVYGNFNITVKPSDKVVVTEVADAAGGGYTVVVTHKDGSTDTFKIHKGFTGNINGYPENVQWGDPASGGGIGTEIPSAFRDDISLNSAGAPSSTDNPSTPPDSTDGDTATYNQSQNVDLYTNYDDQLTNHNVTAPGEVTIHGSSYADSAIVTKVGNKYVIRVFEDKDGDGTIDTDETVETYTVDGASKIILDFLPDKITGAASDDGIIQKGIGDTADQSSNDANNIATQLSDLQGIDMTPSQITDAANFSLNLPPAVPNGEVWKFLVQIDPVLANMLETFKTGNESERNVLYAQIRDRLVSLLQVLYPNAGVSAMSGADWAVDNIMFGGREIDIFGDPGEIDSGDELWELLSFDEQNSEGHR